VKNPFRLPRLTTVANIQNFDFKIQDCSARVLRVLSGPTASGKSAAAGWLARACGAELLSLDSMKLYRRLDIGTAKPTPQERANQVIHLVDIKEPWERCSVAEFTPLAESVLDGARARNIPLIGEGGTALYLKALGEGLFDGPGADEALRSGLEAEAAQAGLPALHQRLEKIDPQAAARIMPTDLRRIVRALEVFAATGKPISQWQSQWGVARSDLEVRLVCLRLPRETLYARIDARISEMLAAGWLEECKRLLDLPRPLSREASQALGYRTLFAHLRGEMTLEQARERVCFDTHHFARRQLNWFKRMPYARFVDLAGGEPVAEVAERVWQEWEIRH
jgi:tRNA dimethylallyltransferase